MARRRDDFAKGVREVLAHRAGFRCSKPDCRAATAGPGAAPEKHGSIGIAAHITAAAPGGPRYAIEQSAEGRASVANGVWLCDNHAREVDRDPIRYTPEILRAWKHHAEEEARAMLGRPLSGSGVNVSMEISLQRDSNDGLLVVGQTNLPESTKLTADLRWHGTPAYFAQSSCAVQSRYVAIGPFSNSGTPLEQRWYQVEVYAYFNDAWAQPEHVIDVIGSDGARLIGNLSHPLDPDLDQTENAVRLLVECPAPPRRAEEPLSAQEIADAIVVVQSSQLDVLGREPRRSSGTVGESVRWFTDSTDVRENEGWQSSEIAPGIAAVKYSFWNGARTEVACWHVVPRAAEVRYRNQYAKLMSWLPT
jgi:hypothetical protein